MGKPRVPTDLLTTNGWWLEIPSVANCHFETLDGLGTIESGTQTITDAGTNIVYKFSDQTYNASELSLTRTLNGSETDAQMDSLYLRCIREGLKFDCMLTKLHNGVEIFRYVIKGFRFVNQSAPSLDVNGGDKYTFSYTATQDYAYKV